MAAWSVSPNSALSRWPVMHATGWRPRILPMRPDRVLRGLSIDGRRSFEVSARVVVDKGTVTLARVAIGGVANIPLRLPLVEARLQGSDASTLVVAEAARLATEGASPLAATGYKVTLIPTVVQD